MTSTNASSQTSSRGRRSAVAGAVFLMGTSAVGPGFLTQTASYTNALGAAFAFGIVLSIVVDIAIQMNIWRVIGVSGRRAQELASDVLPGLGWVLAGLVVLGGFVFNIGNVAGSGLGTDAMLGLDPRLGGALSALVAIAVFSSRAAGVALDRVVIGLGMLMIVVTIILVFTTQPPVGEAARSIVAPSGLDTEFATAVVTIIGGTVGGYITYAGAHRLLESGRTGPEHVRDITRSSITAVLVTGVMRILLFLAILGVVAGGASLASDDPAGSAFEAAAGTVGLRVYGVVLWAAALTSVIGAAYTSVSFLTTSRTSEKTRNWLTVGFIVITAGLYVLLESPPAELLIFAGTFNGLILPLGVGILLFVAWRRRDLLHGYRYPRWLLGIGAATWLLTLYLGYVAIKGLAAL